MGRCDRQKLTLHIRFMDLDNPPMFLHWGFLFTFAYSMVYLNVTTYVSTWVFLSCTTFYHLNNCK